ncbi:MAG TPA: hypothetical protein VII55_00640 [Candidatus Saccharimonadales bacterium]
MSDVLSSDILEKQFGPTEITVLYQDASTRIICTRTVADGRVLELSRAVFMPGTRDFEKTHRAVLDGLSMGKAFRADGIELRRHVTASYQRSLPAAFEKRFGRGGQATVVAVSILVGPSETHYADIIETYSPDVSWPRLGAQPVKEHSKNIKRLGEFLAGQATGR